MLLATLTEASNQQLILSQFLPTARPLITKLSPTAFDSSQYPRTWSSLPNVLSSSSMSLSPVNINRAPQQVNGFYVHSSPPKVLQVHSSVIRQWLRSGDIAQLEQLVLEGQGHKLVGEYSPNPKVRAFLKQVPAFLVKSKRLHEAVAKGDLKLLQKVLNSIRSQDSPMKNIHLSRGQGGLGLLHEAVYYGHPHVAEFLVSTFPQSLKMKDNDGRTPLHYAGASKEAGKLWPLLHRAGADPNIADSRGKLPSYYMQRTTEIQLPEDKIVSGTSISSTTDRNNNIIIKPSNIRIWIHDRDLRKLQQVVWEGHGTKLRVETSKHPKVKRFLEGVPYILNIIKDVHSSVVNNDFEEFLKKISPPAPDEILGSKDMNGLTPLHKAAGLNRRKFANEILKRNQNLVFAVDNDGKTPLHYAAALKDEKAMYNLLMKNFADETALDKNGKTPAYYKTSSKEIPMKLLEVIPEAPRTSAMFPHSFDWSLFCSERTPTIQYTSSEGHSPVTVPNAPPQDQTTPTIEMNGLSPLSEPEKERKSEDSQSKVSEDRSSLTESENVLEEEHSNGVAEEPVKSQNFDIWTNENYNEEENGKVEESEEDRMEENNIDAKNIKEHIKENKVEENNMDAKNIKESIKENRIEENNIDAKNIKEHMKEKIEENNMNAKNMKENIKENGIEENNINAKNIKENMKENKMEEKQIVEKFDNDDITANQEKTVDPTNEQQPVAPADIKEVIHKTVKKKEKTEREIAEERQRLLDEGLLKKSVKTEEGDDVEKKVNDIIEAGDVEKLASMVLNGEGDKLRGKLSSSSEIQNFLDNVPTYMAKISGVHAAARSGSLRDLQSVLDRRKFAVAKESSDKLGATPLHEAVIHGRIPIIKYLGRFPETLSSKDNFGRTPLHYAAALDDRHIYDTLLHLGADPNTEDDEGRTPTFYQDNPGELTRQKLLEGKEVPAEEKTQNREGVSTPVTDPSVHNAEAEISFDEGIPLSKSSGGEETEEDNHEDSSQINFNITDRDEYGQSVLHFAAARAHGRGGLFQLIQESGINLGYRDELYRTARDIAQQANIQENINEIDKYVISLAAKGETGKLIELFLEGYDHITDLKDDEDTDIFTIVSKKNFEKTLSFLKAIPALEEKREKVHTAIREGDSQSVEQIVSESKNGRFLIIGKNGTGRCSIHTAVLCQQKNTAEFIAQKYPETLKIGDNLERTALHYAMAVEDVETLSKILIKCGAKRVVKDLKGRQPTYYFMNKMDILKLQEEEVALTH